MQFAALLIAIDGAELRQAERQVAVGTGRGTEDLAVVRAVHRLEHVLLPFLGRMDGLERVLAVFCIVAGSDIEVLAADVRGDDRQVAELRLLLAQEGLQRVAHDGAAGQPKGQAQADAGREGEELHLLAELAVVTLLGLLEHHEILVQQALLGEGDAVDAGELLALLIAAPISAGDGSQLDSLDHIRILEMRAAAEVGEGAILVISNGAVLQLADQLALVGIALLGEVLQGIGLGDLDALEVLFVLGQFEHLLLDLGQVGVRDGRAAEVHVVVETIFDRGTDTELDAGIQGLERLRHQVGGGVPEDTLRLVGIPFEQRDRGVCLDRARQVVSRTLALRRLTGEFHGCGQYFSSQPRADASGNLISGNAFLKGPDAAVRKRDVDHNRLVIVQASKDTKFLSIFV